MKEKLNICCADTDTLLVPIHSWQMTDEVGSRQASDPVEI